MRPLQDEHLTSGLRILLTLCHPSSRWLPFAGLLPYRSSDLWTGGGVAGSHLEGSNIDIDR